MRTVSNPLLLFFIVLIGIQDAHSLSLSLFPPSSHSTFCPSSSFSWPSGTGFNNEIGTSDCRRKKYITSQTTIVNCCTNDNLSVWRKWEGHGTPPLVREPAGSPLPLLFSLLPSPRSPHTFFLEIFVLAFLPFSGTSLASLFSFPCKGRGEKRMESDGLPPPPSSFPPLLPTDRQKPELEMGRRRGGGGRKTHCHLRVPCR